MARFKMALELLFPLIPLLQLFLDSYFFVSQVTSSHMILRKTRFECMCVLQRVLLSKLVIVM